MEKEPKLDSREIMDDLEVELKKKGYQIERAELSEDEPIQCEKCIKEDNFQFHNKGWFIEGEFYCNDHKGDALCILKDIDNDAQVKRN
jgi:hypothetical protein